MANPERHRRTRRIVAGAASVGITLALAGGIIERNQPKGNESPKLGAIETVIKNYDPSVQVAISDLEASIKTVYKDPTVEPVYPQKSAMANFVHCQVGLNGTDRRESGKAQCAFLVKGLGKVADATASPTALTATERAYGYSLNRWGADAKPGLDEVLRLSRIDEIINSEPRDVKVMQLKTSIERIYEANPDAETIYPKEEAMANFVHAQVGFDGTDRVESGKAQAKRLMDRTMDVYAQTGQIEAFEALSAEYNYSIGRYPGFQPQLYLHLESLKAKR